jgi:hypothetical protein
MGFGERNIEDGQNVRKIPMTNDSYTGILDYVLTLAPALIFPFRCNGIDTLVDNVEGSCKLIKHYRLPNKALYPTAILLTLIRSGKLYPMI